MARYGPAPYMLADELEYLQAYEDVLEKYKGKESVQFVKETGGILPNNPVVPDGQRES